MSAKCACGRTSIRSIVRKEMIKRTDAKGRVSHDVVYIRIPRCKDHQESSQVAIRLEIAREQAEQYSKLDLMDKLIGNATLGKER